MHARGLGTRSRRPATGDGRRDVVCGSARPAPAAIGEILASPEHCRSMCRMTKLLLLPRHRHCVTVRASNEFVKKWSHAKASQDASCDITPRSYAHAASATTCTTTTRGEGDWRRLITADKSPSAAAAKVPLPPILLFCLCDNEMWECRHLHAVEIATALVSSPQHPLKDKSLTPAHGIAPVFRRICTCDKTLDRSTSQAVESEAVPTTGITCARSGESSRRNHCFDRSRQLRMPPVKAVHKKVWQAQISAIVTMSINYACPREVPSAMRGGTNVC